MRITCTGIAQRTFVTRNFAPDCRGAVKRGLTVHVTTLGPALGFLGSCDAFQIIQPVSHAC